MSQQDKPDVLKARPDLAFATMALIDGMRLYNACMPGGLPDARAQALPGTIFSATLFD